RPGPSSRWGYPGRVVGARRPHRWATERVPHVYRLLRCRMATSWLRAAERLELTWHRPPRARALPSAATDRSIPARLASLTFLLHPGGHTPQAERQDL